MAASTSAPCCRRLCARLAAATTLAVVLACCSASALAQQSPPVPSPPQQASSDPNACPSIAFDPTIDYFPNKPVIDPTAGFEIKYGKAYKIITSNGETYALQACWANSEVLPNNLPSGTKIIKIPAAVVAVKDSPEALDAAVELGVVDKVRFLGKPLYDDPVLPCALAAKANGTISELSGTTGRDSYSVLFSKSVDAGNNKAVTVRADEVDAAPMAKAEWIKFFSAFFNLESIAAAKHAAMKTAYTCRKDQLQPTGTKPTVAWISQSDPDNAPNTWTIHSGLYARSLIADAGGQPLQNAPTGSIQRDALLSALSGVHVVIDATHRASKNVEFTNWLTLVGVSTGITDERVKAVPGLARRHLYGVDRSRSKGGNEEFPLAYAIRPNYVLQDLISILYPTVKAYPMLHEGEYKLRRFLRSIGNDDGYAEALVATQCGSTPPIVPSNADECAAGLAPYTGTSSIIPGADVGNSEQGKNEPGTGKASQKHPLAGAILASVVCVLLVAGFIVFVAPKLARRYRERKNAQYMQEML